MTTTRTRLAAAAAVALAVGCTRMSPVEKFQRTAEMVDHQEDLVGARDAIVADDLARTRGHARSLARPDWFPGLGPEADQRLAAVRAEAERLAAAEDLEEAAARLTGLTAQCAACHAAMAIPAPKTWTGDPQEALWIGLAWESEERWTEGAKDLEALEGADDWAARRRALADTL